jgi:hypothetical protein
MCMNAWVGTTRYEITTGTYPPNNTWFHIFVWYEAATKTINCSYNNGTAATRVLPAHPNQPTSPQLWVGTADGVAGFPAMYADQVVLYDAIPTAQFRSDLYNGGSGRTIAQMQALGH